MAELLKHPLFIALATSMVAWVFWVTKTLAHLSSEVKANTARLDAVVAKLESNSAKLESNSAKLDMLIQHLLGDQRAVNDKKPRLG